jgi:hypothetical protein
VAKNSPKRSAGRAPNPLSGFWLRRNGENLLTDAFAAALNASPQLRTEYAGFVLKDFARRRGWPKTPMIRRARVQVGYPGFGATPDMVLELVDGRDILCEHKIDAIETTALRRAIAQDSVPTESEQLAAEDETVRQLEKYLGLPDVQGVVYVRRSEEPPSDAVLANPTYVRPTRRHGGRSHFLWRDFETILDRCHRKGGKGSELVGLLLDGFHEMHFRTPAADFALRDLNNRAKPEWKQNSDWFKDRWTPTLTYVGTHGWFKKKLSRIALNIWVKSEGISLAKRMRFAPMDPARNDAFTLSVTPRTPSDLPEVAARLKQLASEMKLDRTPTVDEDGRLTPRVEEGDTVEVRIVEMETSLQDVLGLPTKQTRKTEDLEKPLEDRLVWFVSSVVKKMALPGPR